MGVVSVIEIIRLLELVTTLFIKAGLSIEQFHTMRIASGGHLTDEQVAQLATQAKSGIEVL